jgi:hypothetical protein
MKALIRSAIVVLLLGSAAGLVWHGWEARAHPDDEKAKPAAEEEHEHEPLTVALDKEALEHADLQVASLAAATLKPESIAYGRVMDPSALASLDDELAAAEAALEASRAANSRAQSLFQSGENVARKTVETAESQFRADEIKASSLRRRLALEWSATFASMDPAARRALVDKIVRGEAALVRADLPAGDHLTDVPAGASVTVLGLEDQPIHTASVTPATSADPKTQAQTFLLTIETPPFPLRPGMAATVRLERKGETASGLLLPRSAVVRFDGRTWAYVQSKPDTFTRREVELGAPMEGGYFIAEEVIKDDDKVVTSGAQTLLSKEAMPSSTDAD